MKLHYRWPVFRCPRCQAKRIALPPGPYQAILCTECNWQGFACEMAIGEQTRSCDPDEMRKSRTKDVTP